MSYGFDYKERQERNRRQNTRMLFYVFRSILTTAALVAIAFAFDVPEKLRAKFWGMPPEIAQPRPPAELRPSAQPKREDSLPFEGPTEEPLENNERQLPRRQSDPFDKLGLDDKQPAASGNDEVIVPKRPPARELPPLDNLHAPKHAEEQQVQVLVLDLNKKLARLPIATAPGAGEPMPKVRVFGLLTKDAKVEMEPADGELVEELHILFPDHPRARILVRIDKIGQQLFLVAEPQMALWTEDPMAFTLKKIKGEAYQAHRAAAEFHTTLAADKERKSALQIWLNNARGVPLDEHKQGKLRFAELEHSIAEREGKVELVKQGVAELDALEQLAQQLQDKAELHFELNLSE